MEKDKSVRVSRGGSWFFAARYARFPNCRYDFLGFRLSRIVNPLEQLSEVINEKG